MADAYDDDHAPHRAPAAPDAVLRAGAAGRVLLVTLATNVAVSIAKILVGRLFGIVSLTADGIHSLIDGFGNVVGLVALASSARPPDEDHPYGHQKFETFAALGIAGFMGAGGVLLVHDAMTRLGSGTRPDAHPATFAVVVATIVVNVLVTRYERGRGRALGSDLLLADAQHTASDALVSLAVLVALGAIRLGMPAFDLVATLVIAGFIGRGAWSIVRGSLAVLSDAAAIDAARVEAVARAVPGVRSCHKIRTRGPTQHVFVDLHIRVDPQMPTFDSHKVGHAVADALRSEIAGVVDVLVHVEPARVE